MSTPPSARGFPPHPSLMPELDSLSDSDWLDIASGRDSDDNDSFSEQDSDRDEISSLPRSRRSSISNDESMSSDVEAWEGFVSDSGEAVVGMYPVPPPSPFGAEPTALGAIPDSAIAADPALSDEERRVQGLLDQSFIGTLSSSRSSAHTSIRDLRLSFPDPLTSSRNDLDRSYEAVSSSTGTAVENLAKDILPVVADSVAPVVLSPLVEDPGLTTTPAVLRQESQATLDNEDALEIVLYGTPSEIKWLFLQQFVEKAAMTSGHNICDNLRNKSENRTISLSCSTNGVTPFFNTIHVIDRTLNDCSKMETDNDCLERPSLAIVYLPTSQLPNLSWHSCYLPVLIPTADIDRESVTQAAEDDWDLLGVPPARTLRLGDGKSPILDADGVRALESAHLYETLRNIGRNTKKVTYVKPVSEQVKSVNAVTFFALVSIIMGFAFNSSFRSSTPTPTPTINVSTSASGQIWSLLSLNNRSSSLVANQPSRIGSTLSSTSPSSLNDVALSVFDAGSTALSVTSPPSAKSLSISDTSNAIAKMTTTSPSVHFRDCESKASSSRDKSSASTDLIAMPTPQTPSIYVGSSGSVLSHTGSAPSILLTGTDRASAISKSIVAPVASAAPGINLNSVTEALDATTKALAEVVTKDLAEAADVLLVSIREQTDSVIRQSKGKARAFGEQIQNLNEELTYRNERAKRRARELKQKGEEIVRGATSELKRRTKRARKRAKALKQSVVDGGTEAWKTFERVQADWEAALVAVPRDGKENVNAYDCRKEVTGDVKVNRASATLCA